MRSSFSAKFWMGATLKQLAHDLGISAEAVREHLIEAQAQGWIAILESPADGGPWIFEARVPEELRGEFFGLERVQARTCSNTREPHQKN
jgi:DNA-binding transcriptional regulator LsrR (DeoR family)